MLPAFLVVKVSIKRMPELTVDLRKTPFLISKVLSFSLNTK